MDDGKGGSNDDHAEDGAEDACPGSFCLVSIASGADVAVAGVDDVEHGNNAAKQQHDLQDLGSQMRNGLRKIAGAEAAGGGFGNQIRYGGRGGHERMVMARTSWFGYSSIIHFTSSATFPMPESNNHFTPTWTRYVCSLGPASSNPETIEGLIRTGANFFRNNFAHAQYEEYRERKRMVDELNMKLGTHVYLQADLQGRNIRIQRFENGRGGIDVEAGRTYSFYTEDGDPVENGIRIDDATLHHDVKAGEAFILADGAIEGTIEAVEGHVITVKLLTGGFLKDRKSINVPDTVLTGSSITEKDLRDLNFLLEAGVDWVALSFISTAAEVEEVRKVIGSRPVKIMAKIERREALKNINEIIAASDAIMIARGDLGIEVPLEEVPIIQKMLTEACHHAGKPVITATQMLLSMAKALRPTRAEVTDVANAVFDRSDAVMLSEETAEGVDPVNSLRTMVRIAKRAEDYLNTPNAF